MLTIPSLMQFQGNLSEYHLLIYVTNCSITYQFYLFIFSIKHSKAGDCSTDSPALGIGADVQDIVFNYTYSVTWEVNLII